MRVVLAIALIVSGFAGVTAARAADIPTEYSGNYPAGGIEYAERAGMLLVYDSEPGTLVRAYWSAPWRHHHYFPATGHMPKVGRDEHLNVHGVPPRPAKTFYRQWSNAAALQRALELEQPITMLPPDSQSTSPMDLRRHHPKPRKLHPSR